MTGFTKEDVLKAMKALAGNDVPDWDGRYHCYEWEAPSLLAAGIKPERLVIIPREIPTRCAEDLPVPSEEWRDGRRWLVYEFGEK